MKNSEGVYRESTEDPWHELRYCIHSLYEPQVDRKCCKTVIDPGVSEGYQRQLQGQVTVALTCGGSASNLSNCPIETFLLRKFSSRIRTVFCLPGEKTALKRQQTRTRDPKWLLHYVLIISAEMTSALKRTGGLELHKTNPMCVLDIRT